MKKRGGPYAGADIPEFYVLMEELFSPDEAEVNNALPRKPAKAEDIAKILNRNENDIGAILENMADKGLCGFFTENGIRLYQGIPFMPGIFEYTFISGRQTARDKKIAELIYAYKKAYNLLKVLPKSPIRQRGLFRFTKLSKPGMSFILIIKWLHILKSMILSGSGRVTADMLPSCAVKIFTICRLRSASGSGKLPNI